MSKRRGRDEGTIYRHKVNGRWYGQISLGKSPDGKRRRKTIQARTKRELLSALADERSKLTPNESGTVAQFMEWYLDYRKSDCSPNTHQRYMVSNRNQVLPHIGNLVMSSMDTEHVNAWYEKMRRDGVSNDAQRKAAVLMSQAFKKAIELKKCRHNPVAAVKRPKMQQTEYRILTPAEAKCLMEAARPSNFHALVVMALTTGARQGELFGLSWSDIDFAEATIQFTKSLEEVSGRLRIKTPKSRAGRRTVAVDPFTLEALAEHRDWCAVQSIYRANIVFPNSRGSWLRKSNFDRRHWKPILKRAGLEGLRFHDLRHFHATALITANEDIKSIQARLGHANAAVTLSVYGHHFKRVQRSPADAITKTLFSE